LELYHTAPALVIGLEDARLAKRHEKDHDYNKKVYILYEKQVNSHSTTETPTRRVVPEWASRAKIAHPKPKFR